MRMLVLGGGWFAGRAMVAEAAGRGWDVTLFNRGKTSMAPPGVGHVRGDWEHPAELAALATRGQWDVVVDAAGAVPAIAGAAARALVPRTGLYVFVSTVSVYRDWPYKPVDEQSPLWPADPDLDPGTRRWDPDAYGPLKAGCELAIRRVAGSQLLTVRCQVLLGPGEYVGRLPWWLRRVARAGRVLAPAPAGRAIQPADVRDAAAFTAAMAAAGRTGVFNVAAPPGRDTYGGMLDACRAVTGSDAEFAWAEEGWLASRGVREWTELPLWRTLPSAWQMDTGRAQASGLSCRPLAETVGDTWRWLAGGGELVAHERAAQHGLSAGREARLLAEWDRAAGGPC